jgi:hypothetical protein
MHYTGQIRIKKIVNINQVSHTSGMWISCMIPCVPVRPKYTATLFNQKVTLSAEFTVKSFGQNVGKSFLGWQNLKKKAICWLNPVKFSDQYSIPCHVR